MFGFIKNFFGGIMAFFGGILGIGKSKEDKSNAPKTRKGRGYYLELDESQAAQTGNGSKPAQAEAVKPESAPKPESASAPAAVAAAPAPAPKSEPAKAEAATKPAPKSEPAKAEAATKPAPKPETAKAAAPAAKANTKSEPQPPSTFAPNYLLTLSSTNGRRRPGANMNSFLDMARQVKTSR